MSRRSRGSQTGQARDARPAWLPPQGPLREDYAHARGHSTRFVVHRMAFGADHQMAYVTASGVYQDSVLYPWTDLAEKVAELNAHRRVVVQRQF